MLLDVSRYAKENAMSAEAMQAMLDRQGEWFHSFAFSNGCKTNGRDLSARKLDALGLPDLTGKSVIDVGAFEGFFSFQAERLGAKRVVACDHFVWTWPDSNARSNFEIVRDITSSRIEDLTLPVEDLSPDKAGTYDITRFMGVLYHAPDMVGYLRNVKRVTNELVVIETLVDALHIEEPVATFYPPASLNNDSSNWWGPNIACVLGMLRRVGFQAARLESIWDRNTVDKVRSGSHADAEHQAVKSGRAVFHAYV
jgi:tRNA (mo5U34)-methyltransferase